MLDDSRKVIAAAERRARELGQGARFENQISKSGSRISNDMRAEPFDFTSNGGDIDSEVSYGFMRAADISNDAWE